MNKFLPLLFLLPLLSRGQDSLTTISPKNALVTPIDTSKSPTLARKNYLRKDVWRFDFFGPGMINEHRLGAKTTLVSHIRLVGSFRSEPEYYYNRTGYETKNALHFSVNPEISAAVRRFYNLARRKEAGKSIRYNSGSYFAAKAGYILPPVFKNWNIDSQGFGVSGLWGVQQTYRKYLYVNFELGVGVAQYYKNHVSPTGNLMLGYTF